MNAFNYYCITHAIQSGKLFSNILYPHSALGEPLECPRPAGMEAESFPEKLAHRHSMGNTLREERTL